MARALNPRTLRPLVSGALYIGLETFRFGLGMGDLAFDDISDRHHAGH